MADAQLLYAEGYPALDGQKALLNGAIGTADTTITFDTETNGGLPTSGLGRIDNELISWTGKTATQLTGVSRGTAGASTAAAHADNTAIYAGYYSDNTTYRTVATIAAGSFTASKTYLIIASLWFRDTAAASEYHGRLLHGTTAFPHGDQVWDPAVGFNASNYPLGGGSHMAWMERFTQPGAAEAISLSIAAESAGVNEMSCDLAQIFAIKLSDDFTENTNYYWSEYTGTQRALINQVGGITAVATSIPYDTGVGLPTGGDASPPGWGRIDDEDIIWALGGNLASGSMTGVVRGFGGTAAATHADNAVIRTGIGTTTSPQTLASITFTPNGSDDWLIIGNVAKGDVATAGGANTCTVRMAESVSGAVTPHQIMTAADANRGDELVGVNLVRVDRPSAASHTYSLQALEAGGTHLIHRAAIFAINLNTFSQHAVSLYTDSTLTASASYQSVAGAIFSVATTGDWFFMGSATLDYVNAGGQGDTYWRLEDDNGGSFSPDPVVGDTLFNHVTNASDDWSLQMFKLKSLTAGARQAQFEFKTPSGTLHTAKHRSFVAFSAALAASGSQNVSPTSIATGESLGSPTVATGTVNIDAPSIASGEALGSPTIATTYNITGASIASAEALGSPTVGVGAVNIDPPSIATGESLGSPNVETAGGTQNITAPAIATGESLGSPTVATGAVNIDPPSIATGEAMGSPTIGFGLTVSSGIASGESLGSPTVAGTGTITWQDFHDKHEQIDPTKFDGTVTWYFEGMGRRFASATPCLMRMYNVTDSVEVTGSNLSFSSQTLSIQRVALPTGALPSSNKEYKAQIGGTDTTLNSYEGVFALVYGEVTG